MRKRTQGRDFALKILYQADITRREIPLTAEMFWKSEEVTDADEEVKEFAKRLVFGVANQFHEIDAKISKHATNWQLKRMALIDRNILRLGVFELLFAPDIPPKVSINEAVELAKKYGDLDSSKFVNGILDKIHKTDRVVQGPIRE